MKNPSRLFVLFISITVLWGCGRPVTSLDQGETREQQAVEKMPTRSFPGILASQSGVPCAPSEKKLGRGNCAEGYICVPDSLEPTAGTCLIDCGVNENNNLVKRPEACSSDQQCMMLKDAHLTTVGLFCLKQQKYPDLPCETPFDKNACADDLTCIPTMSGQDEEGKRVFVGLRCKRECSVDMSCKNESESCLFPSYARREKQPQKPGSTKLMTCSVASCENGEASCPCDQSLGYGCSGLVAGMDVGICVRTLGICGKPVALAKLEDFRGRNFLGENCNEKNDNRICQLLESGEASSTCKKLSESGEGVCIAPCQSPSLDQDGDGSIGGDEQAMTLSCPADFTCKTDIGRRIGLHDFIENGGRKKICNPAHCQENTPCPKECGPGEAECIKVGSGNKTKFFCGAPIGTCVAN